MPDYASILRRSIAALPNPGPDMREAVYQRARAALARQLTAVDPPLSTREIERQHQELEDAVTRLEADYAAEAEAAQIDDEPVEPDFYGTGSDQDARPPYPPDDAAMLAEQRVAHGYEHEERDDEEGDGDEFEEDERGSRAPLLIGLLLVALVVVGAGAYAFAQRDTLLGYLGLSGTQDEVAAVEPAAPEAAAPESPPVRVVTPEAEPPEASEPASEGAAATDAQKLTDRLANGGQPAAPPEPAPPIQAEVEQTEEPAPPAEEELAEPLQPVPTEAEEPQEQQTAALQEPAQGLVAQRAIYYFQGTEGQPGRATEGTVTWSETSKEGQPAIQATLRLEDRDLTTTVTIHRNEDATLPASHLVEVQFSGGLSESPIQRVPAIVVKETEQARGEPLKGAAVPVTNELFWIALSDEQEQAAENVRLLQQGSWFDIPILFQDGTRALLVFEKGIPGDRVFETVMANWPG